MSVSLPNGALVAIASGYGSAKVTTVATNAAQCVMTSAGHGLSAGDIVEVTSGWSRLNSKVVRLDAVTTDTVTLEDIDTSSTTTYPAAGGLGSFRKITGWTQLSQVLSSGSNGGEQKFKEYQFLESDAETRIPTSKAASGLTFSVADDSSLAGFILAGVANDDRAPRAVRITLASAALLFYNCYISLNRTPSLTIDEIMACEVTMSQLAETVRYTS